MKEKVSIGIFVVLIGFNGCLVLGAFAGREDFQEGLFPALTIAHVHQHVENCEIIRGLKRQSQ